MNRPTLEVADIFRAQSNNFIDQHHLGIHKLKVIRAMTHRPSCRSKPAGRVASTAKATAKAK